MRIVVLSISLIMMLFVMAPSVSISATALNPEQTVEQFYSDFKNLNFRNILKYTSGPAYDLYKRVYDYYYMYHQVPEQYKKMTQYMQILRVMNSHIDNNWAYVECEWLLEVGRKESTLASNKAQQMGFILENENGLWKIFDLRSITTIEM